jgi:hypothetical protein
MDARQEGAGNHSLEIAPGNETVDERCSEALAHQRRGADGRSDLYGDIPLPTGVRKGRVDCHADLGVRAVGDEGFAVAVAGRALAFPGERFVGAHHRDDRDFAKEFAAQGRRGKPDVSPPAMCGQGEDVAKTGRSVTTRANVARLSSGA